MNMRVRTTYLAKCDYPGCRMHYNFWAMSEKNAIMDIINDGGWLCLFTNDNEPRFFCPLHLRYVQNSQYEWLTVFYDSDNPDPLFCHNCGQRFKYVGQDQLAYKHQSNRADILRTLKLKAETQPTFDLAEVNQ